MKSPKIYIAAIKIVSFAPKNVIVQMVVITAAGKPIGLTSDAMTQEEADETVNIVKQALGEAAQVKVGES